MARNKAQMRRFSVIPVLLVVVSALQIILDLKVLAYIDFMVELSVFALLIGMVMIKVFEGGSVTIHRVVGSIVAYMLIGNAVGDNVPVPLFTDTRLFTGSGPVHRIRCPEFGVSLFQLYNPYYNRLW